MTAGLPLLLQHLKEVDSTPWKNASSVTTNLTRLERAKRAGRQRSSARLHVLGEWEDDTTTSAVATCLVCEELAAVDVSPDQPTEYVGRALTQQCEGPYSKGVLR